ncbi:FkbM family methyltransferase [Candidatus Peregrinibacteria bacterium]|nr:FkbM family methyltransferase [Candidatus Peregrinibacteria bacterium]
MGQSKLRKLFNYIRYFRTSRLLLSMMHQGYFIDKGWIQSKNIGKAVDSQGKPIPWLTYSFLDFISDKIGKEHVIFEYGSGNSTLYWAKLCHKLYTVEHNLEWYNKIKAEIPSNVSLQHCDLSDPDQYANTINMSKLQFDVIIIDGRERVRCINTSSKCLKKNGIIVLDDSEREKYEDGIRFLESEGFKKLDFWGISPGYFENKCTSVFFKVLFNQFCGID